VLCLLTLSVGCHHVGCGSELATGSYLLQSSGLQQSTSPHDGFLIVGHFLELSFREVTGTAVVERVIKLALLLVFLVSEIGYILGGVVVPTLDDDLREENERDGVQGHIIALFSLKLPVVEEVS
jgi:hypothetical protein